MRRLHIASLVLVSSTLLACSSDDGSGGTRDAGQDGDTGTQADTGQADSAAADTGAVDAAEDSGTADVADTDLGGDAIADSISDAAIDEPDGGTEEEPDIGPPALPIQVVVHGDVGPIEGATVVVSELDGSLIESLETDAEGEAITSEYDRDVSITFAADGLLGVDHGLVTYSPVSPGDVIDSRRPDRSPPDFESALVTIDLPDTAPVSAVRMEVTIGCAGAEGPISTPSVQLTVEASCLDEHGRLDVLAVAIAADGSVAGFSGINVPAPLPADTIALPNWDTTPPSFTLTFERATDTVVSIRSGTRLGSRKIALLETVRDAPLDSRTSFEGVYPGIADGLVLELVFEAPESQTSAIMAQLAAPADGTEFVVDLASINLPLTSHTEFRLVADEVAGVVAEWDAVATPAAFDATFHSTWELGDTSDVAWVVWTEATNNPFVFPDLPEPLDVYSPPPIDAVIRGWRIAPSFLEHPNPRNSIGVSLFERLEEEFLDLGLYQVRMTPAPG